MLSMRGVRGSGVGEENVEDEYDDIEADVSEEEEPGGDEDGEDPGERTRFAGGERGLPLE
jgi:hypothetical protein